MAFHKNSLTTAILFLLAEVGEASYRTLGVYFYDIDRKILRNAINRLVKDKYILISGKDKDSITSIRLRKPNGLNWLMENDLELYQKYMETTGNHSFSTTSKDAKASSNVIRRHRIADVTALMKACNVLTGLDNEPLSLNHQTTVLDDGRPHFYTSLELKNIDQEQKHKFEFTRLVGCYFFENNAYLVYNMGSGVMKWSEQGEQKAKVFIKDIITENSLQKAWNIAAMVFADNMGITFNSFKDSDNQKNEFLSFFNVMNNIYALPVDSNGVSLMGLFQKTDGLAKIKLVTFGPELLEKSQGKLDCDCDIIDNDVRVLSVLTGNIGRLKRFCDFARTQPQKKFEIICYNFQEDYLKEFCPPNVKIQRV